MDCMSVLVKFQPIMTIPRPNGLAICVFGPLSPIGVSLLDLIFFKKYGRLYIDNVSVCVKFNPIPTIPRLNGLAICVLAH